MSYIFDHKKREGIEEFFEDDLKKKNILYVLEWWLHGWMWMPGFV